MKETKKLTLAELKTKAVSIEKSEVLEKVQGGSSEFCHSSWDQNIKILGNWLIRNK